MKQALLLFLLFSNSLFAQVNLNQGLVAYYPFSGNANDASGNNNNPVFNNATLAADRFGNANSAYSFNGIDNYIQIPNSPSLNPSQISICAWVKVSGFYQGPCHGNNIVMKGDADYLPGNYVLRFDDSYFTNNTNCSIPTPDQSHESFFGVQSGQLSNNPFIQTNQWYSVVFTCDGTTAKTYVNCQLVGLAPANGITFSNGYDLFLGRLNDPQFPYWFNGTMDEVRIYNRALNDDEIKAYGDCSTNNTVTASFTTPDTVCVNTPVQITNTSIGATNYYWNFCVANTNVPPVGANLGNVGGQMQMPVYIDYVYDNGNYYGFVSNNSPAGLLRLDFGNSLLNTPTVTNLGNIGGIIPTNAEGLQIVNDAGNWYVIIVGGDPFGAVISKIVKVELGSNIANNSPIATDWGNIGNLSYPHDLYIFNDNGNWYGFTVNYDNSTITKFDFTNSFSNIPTGVNLGNIGSLNGPTGLHAINDNGNWSLFVTNALSSTLTRIDFGNSLLNVPTAQNLGNPGGLFHTCWDIFVMKFCGETTAFVINANQSYDDLVRLNFGNSITNIPTGQSFGNIGNCLFPHSLSKIFRVGSDLYSFITNVDNNTLTRLQFTGCTNSNTPNSTLQNPPPVTYNLPGVYNINLSVDDGLPTQTTYCKQVVVQSCTDTIINNYTPVLAFDPCDNKITVEDASAFNIGDTVLMIQMKGAVIDSSNTSNFGTITNYKNAGNYEFNYVKSKTGNIVELRNYLTRQYDVLNGKVQLVRVPYYQNITFNSNLTCLPWDGSKGGIVALNVQNTITLNANIDVSGKGFRGGNSLNSNNPNWTCNSTNYYYSTGSVEGAAKGEGITDLSSSKSTGKGPLANGGGGGNQSNAGGGGGSNGGQGGMGGNEFESCYAGIDNRGISGKILNNIPQNKIFLGGGGGSGDANNPPPNNFSSFGGNGGGIIIINAGSLSISNQAKIKANGNAGLDCNTGNCYEGMGGGGGGGTILLNFKNNNASEQLALETNGGKGADVVHTPAQTPLKHGPGGGGGGGVVWLNNSIQPGNMIINKNGGQSGVNINFSNDPWGATSGQNGTLLFNLQIPIDSVLFKKNIDSVKIKDSLVGCNSFNFQNIWFTNTNPINSWQWDFGDGNTGTTQNINHAYNSSTSTSYTVKVIAADMNGCKDSSSISITTANAPVVKANNDTAFCVGGKIQLNTTGAATYTWLPSNGLSNSNIADPLATPAATIQYIVLGTRNDGCTGKDTVNITVYQNPVISKSSDTVICKSSSAQLFAGGGISYSWSPSISLNNNSIANPVATPTSNTIYHVTVIDANNCTNSDSLQVSIRPDPVFAISNSSNICLNNSIQLTASGGNSYSWQPSAYLNNSSISNPTASPKNTTSYSVVITDTVCNNTATLSTTVTVFSLPVITAAKSNDIDCSHDFSQLNVTGGAKYEWSPAATLNGSTIANPVAHPTAPTLYIVKGSDINGCISYDSVMVNITDFNKSGYFMPNAFTPNNDGLNDCYGIKFWGLIQELDFGIYNRWGERIFHTSNPDDCWDGTYKGVQQDPGVYVYLITAKTFCGKVFKKGTFVLIR